MKSCMLATLLLPALLQAQPTAPNAEPLTNQQADAIVATDMAARKAKQEANAPVFRVLERRSIVLPDRTVTMNRVAPPNASSFTERPQSPEMSPAERQALQEEMATIKTVSLSVWVYDRSVSRLVWHHEGQPYVAWVPADLNPCRTIRDFTVGDQHYQLSMFLQNEDIEALKERQEAARQEGVDYPMPQIPALPESQEGVTEYFVESESPNTPLNAAAFDGIEALLAYMDASHESLVNALQRQEAISEARKRYQAANPPSQNVQINYWNEE
ncbi:hypothetical protein [Cerasicoccus fimbriatus]|uniref:hypothetical protein n=1 Tax=Cerasicoccus fimbriatus TaxID=3014554 RepID=UPI0022B5420B|nr:hypothetical protein [Cerasicoccus sp. TK19100]